MDAAQGRGVRRVALHHQTDRSADEHDPDQGIEHETNEIQANQASTVCCP
jgi:hypothetical protein